jgi:hypothetical protein
MVDRLLCIAGRPSCFVRRQSLHLHRLQGGGPMLRAPSFILWLEPPSQWAHYFIPVLLMSSLFLLCTGGEGSGYILNFCAVDQPLHLGGSTVPLSRRNRHTFLSVRGFVQEINALHSSRHSVASRILYTILEESFDSRANLRLTHLLGRQTLPQSVSIRFENK